MQLNAIHLPLPIALLPAFKSTCIYMHMTKAPREHRTHQGESIPHIQETAACEGGGHAKERSLRLRAGL